MLLVHLTMGPSGISPCIIESLTELGVFFLISAMRLTKTDFSTDAPTRQTLSNVSGISHMKQYTGLLTKGLSGSRLLMGNLLLNTLK